MTLPLRRLACALLVATLPLTAADAAPAKAPAVDAGWILSRLARPVPMTTPFVELRGSSLLKAPLRIEGEYRRPDADTLVREVRTPYRETTTVTGATGGTGGNVVIAREKQAPRRFALSRAPELLALQASFGALFAGDRPRLERHYRIQADGARERWSLVLTPRDAALAGKLTSITLLGRGAELRCIETQTPKQPRQRTLLAGAAQAASKLPAKVGPGAFAALCYGRDA
jgi:hypothetical protein